MGTLCGIVLRRPLHGHVLLHGRAYRDGERGLPALDDCDVLDGHFGVVFDIRDGDLHRPGMGVAVLVRGPDSRLIDVVLVTVRRLFVVLGAKGQRAGVRVDVEEGRVAPRDGPGDVAVRVTRCRETTRRGPFPVLRNRAGGDGGKGERVRVVVPDGHQGEASQGLAPDTPVEVRILPPGESDGDADVLIPFNLVVLHGGEGPGLQGSEGGLVQSDDGVLGMPRDGLVVIVHGGRGRVLRRFGEPPHADRRPLSDGQRVELEEDVEFVALVHHPVRDGKKGLSVGGVIGDGDRGGVPGGVDVEPGGRVLQGDGEGLAALDEVVVDDGYLDGLAGLAGGEGDGILQPGLVVLPDPRRAVVDGIPHRHLRRRRLVQADGEAGVAGVLVDGGGVRDGGLRAVVVQDGDGDDLAPVGYRVQAAQEKVA